MAVTPENASYVADETISSVAFDEFFREPMMAPVLFNFQGSSKDQEKSGSIGGLGDFQLKTSLAESSESTPTQQFAKSYIHNEYALQTKFARSIVDDQKVEFFGKFGAKLGQSAARTMEKAGAAVFNDSFTTVTSEDALSLCNTAHLNADGGNSQGNRGTTALSNDAVSSVRQTGRGWLDYDGEPISVNLNMLLLPPELEETGFEIIKSALNPMSALNAANWNQGIGMIVWQYLTDANNWWMLDPRIMKQELHFYIRIALEVFGDGDLFKGQRRVGGYYRESHGASDWRWIYGQIVA